MHRIGKRFGFSAGHWLEGVPEGHKCRRPHGHNYEVEVVLEGATLDAAGMVVDFGELAFLREWVDAFWDHRMLNECVPFAGSGMPTTAEKMAEVLAGNIRQQHPEWGLAAVRVWETPTCWGEWVPEK